jgi:hypothetical protein
MKIKMYLIGVIAMCLLSISSLKAQSEDKRNSLGFGLKAGFNIANVWDSQGEEFRADPKAGMAGGLFLSLPLGKLLGFQPEMLLSQKGFKGSGMLLGTAYSFSRTTTYLDIPLQLQFKPLQNLTLLTGPQFSYLLNQKDTYTFGSNSTEQEQEFKNDNIRKNTLGLVIGGDLVYNYLVLSARAGWDLQSNKGDGTSQTPRYKSRWLQFTIGFRI